MLKMVIGELELIKNELLDALKESIGGKQNGAKTKC